MRRLLVAALVAALAGLVAGLAGLACASLLRAADAVTLAPGRYEVSVRLDLPNIEGAAASTLRTLCLRAVDRGPPQGLGALSENNPYSHCPVANVRQEGARLSFDIICAGGNAAVASATYHLAREAFDGRISMKLGGKNMTLTEIQRGRRVGDCRP